MRKLLLSALAMGVSLVFAQPQAKSNGSKHTMYVASELYGQGIDTIRQYSPHFIKGFAYLRASCFMGHEDACNELREMADEVIAELEKLKPNR